MPTRRDLLSAALALPLSAGLKPARAQPGAAFAALQADLSEVPRALFRRTQDDTPALIHWGDTGAAALAAPGGRWRRLSRPFGAEQMGPGLEGRWAERVSFGPGDILRYVVIEAAPEAGAILELGPGKGKDVARALSQTGYTQAVRKDISVWWRGETDLAIDLAARNPADPFGGLVGKSARIAIRGDRLYYAAAWPMLEALTGGGGEPVGHPDLAEALAALPVAGGALAVQALLLNAQGDLSAAPPGTGLPPWRIGLIIDLFDQGQDLIAAVFSFDTAPMAAQAAERMRRIWDEFPLSDGRSFGATLGPAATGASDQGVPVAWLIAPSQPAEAGGNRGWELILRLMATRQLVPFGL
ncbi:hypothetical protein [Pseudogemmobacter humi]|uniref:Uncharacterized protein n=1 Tax=Pseudogemmobacter humi TaxID=2483812 RepID=A0A3P5XWZ5_9RHOB|nr:hypothetical protein [Pseudogemmobacter humi]VDC32670.1 hypothetical protein XINFAN_03414 [Pseudogemmobacter humi]